MPLEYLPAQLYHHLGMQGMGGVGEFALALYLFTRKPAPFRPVGGIHKPNLPIAGNELRILHLQLIPVGKVKAIIALQPVCERPSQAVIPPALVADAYQEYGLHEV